MLSIYYISVSKWISFNIINELSININHIYSMLATLRSSLFPAFSGFFLRRQFLFERKNVSGTPLLQTVFFQTAHPRNKHVSHSVKLQVYLPTYFFLPGLPRNLPQWKKTRVTESNIVLLYTYLPLIHFIHPYTYHCLSIYSYPPICHDALRGQNTPPR